MTFLKCYNNKYSGRHKVESFRKQNHKFKRKYRMDKEFFSLRKEIKYIIPLQKALFIKGYLDRILMKDSNCTDGAYSVRSLYLDSVNNIDFSEKLAGISARKKVRIRIYNGDMSSCKLEIKEKKGDWQYKKSIMITESDVKEISRGNYIVLKKYFHNTKSGINLYRIMEQGSYMPVVLIEYTRLAYQYPICDTRITLDMNIRSTESNLDIFSSQINYTPILYEYAVLEIKYSGKLMGFLSDMLAQFNLVQSAYSKYCSGRKVYYEFNY